MLLEIVEMKKPLKIFLIGFLFCLLLCLFVFVMVRNAWVAEDAYISFRTVDNFIHGYGLTWNVSERVQAYTHPLWMFLVSAAYALTHEIYYTSIVVSMCVAFAAVVLLLLFVARSWKGALICVGMLFVSKAFMDYTTSGLENPLTYLLLAAFFLVYFKTAPGSVKLLLLSLITSFAALNRMDTILLYIPALAYAWFTSPKRLKGLLFVGMGFIPFALWLLFSLFYYGFPFPNTAYAKIAVGISGADLAAQGLKYLLNSINWDPITLLGILAGLTAWFFTRDLKSLAVKLGMILYILYLVKIGGDFMSGRLLSAPFFCAVILVSRMEAQAASYVAVPALGCLLFIGLRSPYNPIAADKAYVNRSFEYSVADERGFYYQASGLLNADKKNFIPKLGWADMGLKLKAEGPSVQVFGFVGLYGYCAGPKVHVIDIHALTDPLLARMHVKDPKSWRIGHFARTVPTGYPETIKTGKNVIQDKAIAAYWDKLSYIISGPLFDWKRIGEIFKMNFGVYDYLLGRVNHGFFHVTQKAVAEPRKQGIPWSSPGVTLFYSDGVQVDLDARSNAPLLEISLDEKSSYRLVFLLDNARVGTLRVQSTTPDSTTLSVYTMEIPKNAAERGFNRILIQPEKKGGTYGLGHIAFPKPAAVRSSG
jgi:arabinofuranosyltransferase